MFLLRCIPLRVGRIIALFERDALLFSSGRMHCSFLCLESIVAPCTFPLLGMYRHSQLPQGGMHHCSPLAGHIAAPFGRDASLFPSGGTHQCSLQTHCCFVPAWSYVLKPSPWGLRFIYMLDVKIQRQNVSGFQWRWAKSAKLSKTAAVKGGLMTCNRLTQKAQRPTVRPHEFWDISCYRDARMQQKTLNIRLFLYSLSDTETETHQRCEEKL